MNAAPAAARTRNRLTVALIGALFVLPLVVAFGLYYGAGYRPARHTNHGELILPARALPASQTLEGASAFTRLWSLVYLGAGCDADCERALYVIHQTRLALNNDAQRVQRVLVSTRVARAADAIAREHPGVLIVDASGERGAALVRQFPEGDRAHAIFIVDPLGNLMMRFDSRADPKGLREDLTQLLRLSHVG